MNTKTKKELNTIIDNMVDEYNNAGPDEKSKILANLIKGINVVKEVESQAVENKIKIKRHKLDENKLELEKERMILESEKLQIEKDKIRKDQEQFEVSTVNDIRKLELEDLKLEFEKEKFDIELNKAKTDKLFNGIMKGLEIGLPLFIYGGLSVLALKATYKDDVRVPSETWSFIRSVFKR